MLVRLLPPSQQTREIKSPFCDEIEEGTQVPPAQIEVLGLFTVAELPAHSGTCTKPRKLTMKAYSLKSNACCHCVSNSATLQDAA